MSVPAAYFGVILIWSTTPLAIKWSGETGFLFGVTGRVVLAVLLGWLIIRLWRIAFPWHRTALWAYLAASLSIYGTMIITYWGAQFIPSGLISVLFGLMPIITGILTILWLDNQRLSMSQWIGMLLGFIGLVLIFKTELNIGSDPIKGLIAILTAVFLHSLSAVWIKRLNISISPLAITTGGLSIALPLYGMTWLWFGETWPQMISLRTALSVVYLGLFGSVLGLTLYYYILKHIEASRAALITLITPIIALFLGQKLNGEQLYPTIWLGSLVILTGLSLYQWGDNWFSKCSKNKV